ncbi:MAG: Jag N-terminal domain-containing protein [Deltaproteobacteria bacterium]|nr:Jag N-terminal domain-containing protein [Deltaproteobacteria bacterium]
MVSEYEFEGKTKEEALARACEELGLTEDQMATEVLSRGSTGIFGLVGIKKAKIKVTVPEQAKTRNQESPPASEGQENIIETAKRALEKIVSYIIDDATVTVTTKPECVVEGYRNRRKVSLTKLALHLGNKVKQSGKPATISPMNAYDRRIVHIALQDESEVRTQSKGTGSFRKLIIYPQRKQKQASSQ